MIFTPRICVRYGEPARTTRDATSAAADRPRREDSPPGEERAGRPPSRGDVGASTTAASPTVSASHTTPGFHARPRFAPPSDTLNTRTALTLYLLIVSVITARTVALTLIKVQLNKTKTENNHFCLTGKMVGNVTEAVTTHAPLAKHMFFRPEVCAGPMRRAGGAAPRDRRSKLRVKNGGLGRD